MRLILGFAGILMILAGIAFGIYVGVAVCFVGGIVDIINQIKSDSPVDALTVVWAIVKIFFAAPIGYISAALLILPGLGLLGLMESSFLSKKTSKKIIGNDEKHSAPVITGAEFYIASGL